MDRVIRAGRASVLGLVGVLCLLLAFLSPSGVAAADEWATFGRPSVTTTFADGPTFTQTVDSRRDVERAEVLVQFADSPATNVFPVPVSLSRGSRTLRFQLEPTLVGHLTPNMKLTARWRLVAADDPADVAIGPPLEVTYADDRFDWRTEVGDLVRVHWYEGSAEFGARALRIGEDGVRKAADLLGVTETEPVDFYVYADQDAFYDALGPGTRENVGGQANAEIRTLFALIEPSDIGDSWVKQVIPHELTHLVFDTAAKNPYHFPPRWLNEGLAVYLSQGYDASDRGLVESAAANDSLIALDGLTGQFPTSYDRFALAYAESVSAVDYLMRTHGERALVSLIRSYADGRTDDEAFEAALGADMTAFGAAWLEDLGAKPPTSFGPKPAPAGPMPADWGGTAPAPPPDQSSSAPPVSAPTGPGTPAADDSFWVAVVVVALLAAALIGATFIAARRQARGVAMQPATGWSTTLPPPDTVAESTRPGDTQPGPGPPE